MNRLERQLEYPFGEVLPQIGATLEVAPSIKWTHMALPFALDPINLWLLREEMDDADRPGHANPGLSGPGRELPLQYSLSATASGTPPGKL